VPDEFSAIAAGFANSNAFYIGNDKLGELSITTAQMCSLASSVRLEDGSCQWSCIDIPDVEGWDLPACDECSGLGNGLKSFIAMLSGQAQGQAKLLTSIPQASFQGVGSSQTWTCRHYSSGRGRLVMPEGDDQKGSSWYIDGYGISLWVKQRGFLEVGAYPGCAQSWPFDVDTFQVRVKLEG